MCVKQNKIFLVNVKNTTRMKGKKLRKRARKIKHQCEQCDYASSFSNALKKHVESVHLGKRYQCSQCEYSTPIKGSLRKHMKSKHPCAECAQTLEVFINDEEENNDCNHWNFSVFYAGKYLT